MKIESGKPVFENGEAVEVAMGGDPNNIVRGCIVGVASYGVMDNWIILVNENERHKLRPTYPFDAMVAFHPFIRTVGSNERFWCEQSAMHESQLKNSI